MSDKDLERKLGKLGALNQLLLDAIDLEDPKAIPFQLANRLKKIIAHDLCAIVDITHSTSQLLAVTGQTEVSSESPFYRWLKIDVVNFSNNSWSESGKDYFQFEKKSIDQAPDWLPSYGSVIKITCDGSTYLVYLASQYLVEQDRLSLVQSVAQSVMSVYKLKTHTDGARGIFYWFKNRTAKILGILFLLSLYPAQETITAPAEIVPTSPGYMRSDIKGIVDRFTVSNGDMVSKGDVLAYLDGEGLAAEKAIAQSELETAKAEYDQALRSALNSIDSRDKINLLRQRVKTSEAKLNAVIETLAHIVIKAPSSGLFLIDDQNNWIGRPVEAGETIAWIADPDDVEIQVSLPVNDAIIPVQKGTRAVLFLNNDPSSTIDAHISHAAYQATPTPQGYLAFDLKAKIDGQQKPRLGLRGVVNLYGSRSPLLYQWLRRPLASIRQFFGV